MDTTVTQIGEVVVAELHAAGVHEFDNWPVPEDYQGSG